MSINRVPGRVGILISGRGSNMTALLDAMEDGRIEAEPAVVISNRHDSVGLNLALGRDIPTAVVDHKEIKPRAAHEQEVVRVLQEYKVNLVCLAGYMRLLTPFMVDAFRGRIINIHPSLLPAFPGLNAQQQALDYGATVSGCTIHFVDEECDHGPIITQAVVPIESGDTVETLSARILEQEHRIYPQALAWYYQNRLRIEGRRVRILAAAH